MKFRCPYCTRIFGPAPRATCPHCGKDMIMPDRFQKHPRAERKQAKDRISREADRQRRAFRFPSGAGRERRPSTVFMVLIVMIVVAGFLLGKMGKGPGATRRDPRVVAAHELRALRIASERFRVDCGRYPLSDEGLKALVIDPPAPGWNGPYVSLVKPDPWHEGYHYACAGETVLLFSRGPDRNAGTVDDIIPGTPSTEDIHEGWNRASTN